MRPPSQAWCYRNLKWQNEASVLWLFCTINFKFWNGEEERKQSRVLEVLEYKFSGKTFKVIDWRIRTRSNIYTKYPHLLSSVNFKVWSFRSCVQSFRMVVGNGEWMKEIQNIHIDKVLVLFNKRQAMKCLSFGKMFSLGQIWKLFSGANLRGFFWGNSVTWRGK